MFDTFISERIGKLRTDRKISAREMSLALGQNENYINQIENNKTLPSMQVFFYICDYFNILPKDFFDDGKSNPILIEKLVQSTEGLQNSQIENLTEMAKGLQALNRTK